MRMTEMNATTVRLVLLLGSLLACSGAWPQGDFALEYREFKTVSDDPFPLVAKWITRNKGRPKGFPKSLHNHYTCSFTARAAGREVLLATSMAAKAKVYVDLDGDGDFSGAKILPRLGKKAKYWHGPVVLPLSGSKGKLAARFNVAKGRQWAKHDMIILSPAGYRTGTVQLGTVAYQIALVDSNLNGRYDDVCTEFDGDYEHLDADCFAIDLNHDKQFDLYQEVCPLTKRIWVRGAYYSLRVLPDGSKVRLQRIKPEFELGKLDVGSRGVELVVFSPELGVPVLLEGKDGKWNLPAGKYTVTYHQLYRLDGKGEWTLKRRAEGEETQSHIFLDIQRTRFGDAEPFERRLRSEKKLGFTISAGETQELKIGSPLHILTTVRLMMRNNKNATVLIKCKILGQAGEEYEHAVIRSGRRAALPMFRILDETGKALKIGRFERRTELYGTTGYMWKVSRQFEGKFRVEVIPDVGPFEVTQDEQWRTVPKDF
jgi:hypothetical protein